MAKEGEHPNTKEPMNTQEILNTMVANQIQLKEDMNHMMQQFQNSKNNQEGTRLTMIHQLQRMRRRLMRGRIRWRR